MWSLAAVLAGLSLGGCSLSSDSQQDDEKEPHFVLGKGRVNAMDYTGAIEAFKESLEVSPRSAAAHYQLAWIYENKLTNSAAAIYHYQEYLDLNPKAENRDLINQRIYTCKQQLGAEGMPSAGGPGAQRQLERLAEQNHQLQDEVDKWHAYYKAELAARANPQAAPPSQPSNPAPSPAVPSPGRTAGITPPIHQTVPSPAGGAGPGPTAPYHPRTHVVASRETLASIARKAGVSLAALESANPGLDSRHLRPGQTIYLP